MYGEKKIIRVSTSASELFEIETSHTNLARMDPKDGNTRLWPWRWELDLPVDSPCAQ